jgi:beta-1,4-mannosyl-glycoprotein beta-1,4-N-acetylglucosaminyltransferase
MKIYDTFIFFNELDLLEIRLNILNEVVDQFVLVEATRTFQNKAKPLYFLENKLRFTEFMHKIIHVIVTDMPDSSNTRLLEAHQRNSIARGLIHCEPGDQILLSDLDEIPDPAKVAYAANLVGVKAFRQGLYYYYLNYACCELNDLPWSFMADYTEFKQPHVMRQHLIAVQAALLSGSTQTDVKLIERGGWHFSYLGGTDAILRKLEAFADPEYNKQSYRDADRIARSISDGCDLFGRDLTFFKVPLDERFPIYIRTNRDRFGHLIHG